MVAKFTFYEIVRVLADPPRIREALADKEGIVVGMSDSSDFQERDYGVHINDYGETFAIPEHLLESTGRFGSRKDIVSRDPRPGVLGMANLLLYLSSGATNGYGTLPIPSSIDEKVSELIASFEAIDAGTRQAMLSNMEERHGFVLIAFAERMASLTVRTKQEGLIVSGLSALAIAAKLAYFKEVMTVMSLLYRSVQKLGLDSQRLLSAPDNLADHRFREFVNNFLNRSEEDRSIEAMGYEESSDTDGFRYHRTW